MEDMDRTLVDVGNGVRITMPCDKLMSAMAQMQAVLDTAKKDSDNPYFKSKYADLAQCLLTAKKPMADNGLSISQHCTFDGVFVQCVTVLGHTSGQLMVSTLNIPVSKKDAQGIGSSITYARRYALSSIVGIAQKDDDGNNAVGITQEEIEKKQEERKAKEEAEAKAMAENQAKLDATENWRLTNEGIEVKGQNGFVPISKLSVEQLEAIIKMRKFADVKAYIEREIANR